jgi:hypothetical protein
MSESLDEECRAAVERAVHLAELLLANRMSELDAARAIGSLGTVECLEYIQEGFDFVDSMGAFWDLVYLWEMQKDNAGRQETLRKIRNAVAEFLVEARRGLA